MPESPPSRPGRTRVVPAGVGAGNTVPVARPPVTTGALRARVAGRDAITPGGGGADKAAAVFASTVPVASSRCRFWNSSNASRVPGPKNLRLTSWAETG